VIGASAGGTEILGPSGPGTLIGLNVLPGEPQTVGSVATVDLLTGDGTVAAAALPSTTQQVEDGLAPAGSLVGAAAGPQLGEAVTEVTDGLAPTVATVTATANQLVSPVLATVNEAVAPVTDPVIGDGGTLAPVTGLADNVLGGLPGSGETGPSYAGPLIGATLGDQSLTGPSTSDTLVGANVLDQAGEAPPSTGQLATVDVLSQDKALDVTVPTTAAAVEAGLAPVGNLAGAALGPQAGAIVDQVSSTAAPIVAPVTTLVDAVTQPVLDTANSATSTLPGESGDSPLAPVTGLVDTLLGGEGSDAGGALAPVTTAVDTVLGTATGDGGDAGGVLAPVTGAITGIVGGVPGSAGGSGPTDNTVLAPVTGLLGGVLNAGQ